MGANPSDCGAADPLPIGRLRPALGQGAGMARAPVTLSVPSWLRTIDDAVIVLVNLALIAEVTLVFSNTVLRATFNATVMPGVEETSRLFLIMTAFLGGAVAYGRGRFMAITFFVDRLGPGWRPFFDASVAWMIIVIAAVIGGYSIPLLILNAGEHTTMLGIGYVWMTLPMTFGCALFVVHAGVALSRRPARPVALSAGFVGAVVLAFVLARNGAWVDTSWLYVVLAGVFVAQIAIGVPVGFVLATVGLVYIHATGAAPLIAVPMNAQRGVGGFIFLALPFFILAGFIMDRGGIGSRIVDFLSALIGHFRGGLMQVSIVGMYIASGISGSKAADMAAIGIPMNRTLRRAGYDPDEATAVLAASAAMGESIPPSIAILALGSVTSVSTGALFLAGLLPAATIAAGLMLLVYIRALSSGLKAMPRASRAHRIATARQAFIPLLMPVLLIGGIVAGVGTPTEISSFAVVYGLLLGVGLYRQIGRGEFWQVVTDASLMGGMIFFTFSGATIFSWALSLEGVPDLVASALRGLGPTAFLPLVIAITIVMGAVLESIVTVVILGPLLLPVAVLLGVDPLQYGIVLIEAFGIGSIIPPVGLALYIACAICETDVDRVTRPLVWYLGVLCLGLLLVAFVPWITLVLPLSLHFKG
ncbi:MAG: TRAP transporter large permease subunit [Hyphomicrobiales bacterium]